MIRRMMWRNLRSLYKRTCGLCGKSLISMYKEDGAPVYCTSCFSGTEWNPFSYGMDYDFSKEFFPQLKKLFFEVPRNFAYQKGQIVNSDFTNYSADNKNAYLSYSVIGCEDIMYSDTIDKSKNCMDCFAVEKLENCYSNVDCEGNYNCFYAVNSRNCIDSLFIYDCVNCQNCCLSSNLRNQSYVFKNQKLSKAEYEKRIKELQLDTYSGAEVVKGIFDDLIEKNSIHRFTQIYNSQNVFGDHISNSRNVKYGFDVKDSENVHYASRVIFNSKDSYDLQGLAAGELIYEGVAASFGTYRDFFCYITLGSKECEYSMILQNCSYCFGCVGLSNAKYCILNKQYSEEDYFALVEKIKKHMMDMPYVDNEGRVYKYGEFFPFDMAPFSYNESVALDYFPIEEIKAKEKGYPWKYKEKRDYRATIESTGLEDSILDVSDSVLEEIIACPNDGKPEFQCTAAFRVMPNELSFYRQKNLPLSRFCPNCRHYERLKYRNPMKLWHRQCMCDKKHTHHDGHCQIEFETSYAPDRSEMVYCEKCYQQEVY